MILVVNAGSSSVKFTLFAEDATTTVARGIVERIGVNGTRLKWENCRNEKFEYPVSVQKVTDAVSLILKVLTDEKEGVISDVGAIRAVGHRVVHGGEELTDSVVITDKVKETIVECAQLAPLHNPPNLEGIDACELFLPDAIQVAVFDTAFHNTIPECAYLYGLPYRFYREYRLRRYGFHGISHKFVAHQAESFLAKPLRDSKIITCHLGNGCSMTAVMGGKSVDTTMGFTPLEGLIMGTRSGDLDPAIVTYLMEKNRMDHRQIEYLMNHQSGLLGLAEIGSGDLRDIEAAREAGNAQADRALLAFCYRIRKYIGAFAAAMAGLDALVFTAGIGENSPLVRRLVCEPFGQWRGMKIVLDEEKNLASSNEARAVHSEQSEVQVLVIPTNEEKEIAEQTSRFLKETAKT